MKPVFVEHHPVGRLYTEGRGYFLIGLEPRYDRGWLVYPVVPMRRLDTPVQHPFEATRFAYPPIVELYVSQAHCAIEIGPVGSILVQVAQEDEYAHASPMMQPWLKPTELSHYEEKNYG